MQQELYTYRMRLVLGVWCILTLNNCIEFPSFVEANEYAFTLQRAGYIDADRSV